MSAQETIILPINNAYVYDPAGNRTVEQIDDDIRLSAYGNLNWLTSQAPGGAMVVAAA